MSDTIKHNPRVSIITPCYNHGRFLPDAVASVVAQTEHDWELIIVDDGSTDDSAVIAERLIAQYSEHAIQLIRQPNSGLSTARNTAIAAARSAYILPLDADDSLQPEAVAAMSAVLDEQPQIGFVYSDVLMIGAENIHWSGGAYSVEKLRTDNPMVPMTMFRRVGWEQVGGFRTDMRLGSEDWDFWLALAEAGWQGWHIARPLVCYRRTNGSMLAGTRRRDIELRAHIIENHPSLFTPDVVAWARRVRSPRYSKDDVIHTRALWLRAFTGYAWLVARHTPRLLPKTLVRPLFVLLSARQQGYARRLAKLLRMTQSTTSYRHKEGYR